MLRALPKSAARLRALDGPTPGGPVYERRPMGEATAATRSLNFSEHWQECEGHKVCGSVRMRTGLGSLDTEDGPHLGRLLRNRRAGIAGSARVS